MTDHLTSVNAVIDALGGTTVVASLFGFRRPTPVSNWRVRGSFPSDKYLVMQAELNRRGLTAPPWLWGMAEPVGEAAE